MYEMNSILGIGGTVGDAATIGILLWLSAKFGEQIRIMKDIRDLQIQILKK